MFISLLKVYNSYLQNYETITTINFHHPTPKSTFVSCPLFYTSTLHLILANYLPSVCLYGSI